jgi:hypothetical protein
VNGIVSNISSQTISTTNLFASLLSTNRLKTNDIGTSTVTFNSGLQNSVLSLSNDGQALLVNGIPTGTFKSVSTATTNLNMNNFGISNVTNLVATNIFTNLIDVNSISSLNIKANTISTNTLKTNSINVSSIAVYDAFTNTYLNPINASNGNLYINNQLNVTPYFTFTSGIINNGVLDNCNNSISNVLQTNYISDAATNRTLPTSILVTNSNTSNIGIAGFTGFTLMAVSDTPVSFNTPFTRYRVSFYFSGSAFGSSQTGCNGFYCVLSNTNAVYPGLNVNDQYTCLNVNQSVFNPNRTTFQYTDIFDTGGDTAPMSVLLYGQTNLLSSYQYTNVNFNAIYEPLLS